MGLFDQILGAVSNPNQQGSLSQIGGIINAVQQISGSTGTDPSTMQTLMSVVGSQVRSALQQKQVNEGQDAVQNIVNQFAGNSPNPAAVASLFSPGMQQQVAQLAAQRTGLDANMIQQILPTIVPMILNFLKSGASVQGSGNSVLSSFLDADGDGDVDIADMMRMASQYMGR
ncbi:MAG: DUF937 domain-containing protein [Calothrix sp. C42_A2020_038]|nr:DUF937 domain-containing protein [Calothrix sp. C42_A2020_038]